MSGGILTISTDMDGIFYFVPLTFMVNKLGPFMILESLICAVVTGLS